MTDGARYVSTPEVVGVTGAVVAVDVIRAFTTAAYAFSAGARAIYLVAGVDDALAFVAAHPGAVAMGEMGGHRPDGFGLSNSPARAAAADLDGRLVVQRTSAGTQGVVAAASADRLWAASLVCASATAAAVSASGLGAPTYVITGHFLDRPDRPGADDVATAEHIEAIRLGSSPDPLAVARTVLESDEAARTLTLGPDHVDERDIAFATDVDRFAFAMEVQKDADGLKLTTVEP